MSGQGWTKGFHRPKRTQRSAFALKAATPNDDALPLCPIPGCGRPPQARAGRGLSRFLCRYHVQHKNRHGSLWKGTYSAPELKPYRQAAESYLKAHADAPEIVAALSALHDLQYWAGPVQRMVDVLTMKPKDKARAFFARLRANEVPPSRLLAIHLAVTAAVAEDPVGPGGEPDEYRLVQIAKAAHRTASGGDSGGVYYRYARSTGLVLRHIGRALEEACAPVAAAHLAAILRLKAERHRHWLQARRADHLGIGRRLGGEGV
jgi:hypothetical protein